MLQVQFKIPVINGAFLNKFFVKELLINPYKDLPDTVDVCSENIKNSVS